MESEEALVMDIYLANSLDHAFLALAIKEASRAAGDRGGTLGRTGVQKILYFMKICGVPMNYRFDIHHYGPFCATILRDCEWLIADDVIVDSSNDSGRSAYVYGETIDDFLSRFDEELSPYKKVISAIANEFGHQSPSSLEIFATLDFLYREDKARGVSKEQIKDSVIERFQKVKPNKFSIDVVNQAYARMKKLGLIQ